MAEVKVAVAGDPKASTDETEPGAALFEALESAKRLLRRRWRLPPPDPLAAAAAQNGGTGEHAIPPSTSALKELGTFERRVESPLVYGRMKQVAERLSLLEDIDRLQAQLLLQPADDAIGSSWGSPWADASGVWRREVLLAGFIAAFIAVVTYANAVQGAMTFDDVVVLRDNPDVKGSSALRDLFLHDYWGNDMHGEGWTHKSFRPLTVLTFRLQYAASGLPPLLEPYHVANIALHAAVSFLSVALARAWGAPLRICAAAGVIFACHPVHVEAIANVSGRAEPLAAVFVVVLFLVGVDGRGDMTLLRWATLTFLALAAMLCKEVGLMVLPIAAAFTAITACWGSQDLDGGFVGRTVGRALGILKAAVTQPAACSTLLAFFLVAAVRFSITGGTSFSKHSSCETIANLESAYERFLSIAYLQSASLLLCVWPDWVGMAHNHNALAPVRSLQDPRSLVSAGVALGFIGLVLWCLGGRGNAPRRKVLLVSAVWFAGFYAPASHAFFPVGLVVADRVMYLPSLGLTVGLLVVFDNAAAYIRRLCGGAGLKHLRASMSVPIVAVLFTVAVTCARRTRTRNEDWSSQLNLFRSSLRVYPVDSQTHWGIGDEHWRIFKKSGLHAFAALGKDMDIFAAQHPEHFETLTHALGNVTLATEEDGSLGEAQHTLCRMKYELGDFAGCTRACLAAYNAKTREAAFMLSLCQLADDVHPARLRTGFFAALESTMIQTSRLRPRLLNGAAIAAVNEAFFADRPPTFEFPLTRDDYPSQPDPAWALARMREALEIYARQADGDGGFVIEHCQVQLNVATVLARTGLWAAAAAYVAAVRDGLARVAVDGALTADADAARERLAQVDAAVAGRDASVAALDYRNLLLLTST